MPERGAPEPDELGTERSGDVVPLRDRLSPYDRPPARERPKVDEPELPGARTWGLSASPAEQEYEEGGTAAFGPASARGLPARLTPIVEAAERAAEDVRLAAEARARERIAEADRAAENRVRAAETEVGEILAGAQNEAERLRLQALETVGRIHTEAEQRRREAEAVLERARQDAEAVLAHARQQGAALVEQAKARGQEMVAEAEGQVEQVRVRGREEARAIVSGAHAAVRDVAGDGAEISENLRELSVSLRNNAERLLRDIRMVHGSMVSRLERATPEVRAEPPSGLERASSASPAAPGRSASRADADAARASIGGDAAGGGPEGGDAAPDRRSRRRRGRPAPEPVQPPPGEFDVPEFLPRRPR